MVIMGKLNFNLLLGDLIVDLIIILNNSDVLLNGGDLLMKYVNENNVVCISIMGGWY